MQPSRRLQGATPQQEYPNSITITNPIHPLFGQSLAVRHVRHLQNSNETLQIFVDHPDGKPLSVFLADVNWGKCEQPNSNRTILFEIEKLMRLAELISVAATDFN